MSFPPSLIEVLPTFGSSVIVHRLPTHDATELVKQVLFVANGTNVGTAVVGESVGCMEVGAAVGLNVGCPLDGAEVGSGMGAAVGFQEGVIVGAHDSQVHSVVPAT